MRCGPSKGNPIMTRKTTTVTDVSDETRIRLSLQDQLMDELLSGATPDDIKGPDGIIQQLVGRLVNRALSGEMTAHLGYENGQKPPEQQSNRRNGSTTKTVHTNHGDIKLEVPRDREGTFEPELIPKHHRRFDGFDDKVISMYARGMSTRDIRDHLKEIYGVTVSPDLISTVTDGITDELKAWHNRPLDPVYLVVYLDAMVVKIRDKGVVSNKSVYLSIGVSTTGRKEVLGMWIQHTEGAKFWLSILTQLRQRGIQDIFVLCADGLTGMSDAVEATFPQTTFQTCIVHMIRSSVRFVPWKNRKAVCADLKAVYGASSADDARDALDAFEGKWGERFPMVAEAWRRRWSEVIPFLDFPPELRKVIYTTNAIEATNRQVRKAIKSRGHFPSDDAATKLIYLALRNASTKWGASPWWSQALLQFAIYFKDRLPHAA